MRRLVPTLLAGLVLSAGARGASAADPASLFGGRLRLGVEATAGLAPDDEGYFNYGDYESSTLRRFRLDVAAEARLGRGVALLADLRSDNLSAPRVYALYLRLTPWRGRAFDVQAGMVPPVFGAFPRRRYAADNPLPSLPLAYQYLTNLRYDAVPANAEQLTAQRGRGWLVAYPVGEARREPGVPLVAGERWDTGVQARLGRAPLSLAVALTQGSPSHPRVRDDNGGKQLALRLAWQPGPGLVLGVSGARAQFLDDAVGALLPPPAQRPYRQHAAGVDAEWSRGYWLVRAEGVFSRWRLPALDQTRIESPLAARGGYLEARYKLRPGLYAAARAERLTMSEVDTAAGPQTWDAPVTRFEAGLGYSPLRRLLLKASWQHNRRDGGRVLESDLFAVQVAAWY